MKSGVPRLRVGFVGVGSVARYHAEVLLAMGHSVDLGCGTSESSPHWREFKSVATGARFENDLAAVLEDSKLDAVVACLPWNVTETWLNEILSTPKPVLLEKPIALSSEILANTISNSEATLHNKLVGFNRRFYRTVKKLKKRVEQGGVKSVEITISETVADLANTYGDEIIEHILVYSSCHILDTAVHILGPLKPVRVYGFPDSVYSRPFHSLTGLLETTQGTPVFLSIMADNPAPVGLRIFFEDQTTWHLSPLERLVAYRGYDIVGPSDGTNIRRFTPKPFLEIDEDSEFKPGFFAQMRAFADGEERHISATPQESLELLRFIETLQRSAGQLATTLVQHESPAPRDI